MSTIDRVNLLSFNRQAMRDYFVSLGDKAFRGDQVLKWIHQTGLTDFDQMLNVSKPLRAILKEKCEIRLPEIVMDNEADDGTRKFLLKMECGNCIEAVFIPENNRGTLCISSQIGCSLNCTFCATGAQGYNRDLTTSEIIAQLWVATRALHIPGSRKKQVTNVVMMGMGEPLMNFDNVVAAMDIMRDDLAYGISKYRLTLSTSGVVPKIYELAKVTDVALAVSLHAPNDELRTKLVPINKKYPISELMAACKHYFHDAPRRHITIEYVMLAGINDQAHHAKQLIKVLEGVNVKVNLIPFNPFPGTQYICSEQEVIDEFRDILMQAGVITMTRKTRGDDIDAACGQLAGEFHDRTSRSRKLKAIPVEIQTDMSDN